MASELMKSARKSRMEQFWQDILLSNVTGIKDSESAIVGLAITKRRNTSLLYSLIDYLNPGKVEL